MNSTYHHTTSHRRKQLLNEKGVPSQMEVRQQLGSPLTEIFFDSLNEKCRKLMGLEPELLGPEEPLRISPSDALMNKLVFTKPPSHRCVQALQHRTILELGGMVIQKFQNELQAEIINTITDIDAACKNEVNKCVIKAIEETRAEERQKCEESKAHIIPKFLELIVEEVKLIKEHHNKQTRTVVQEERAELHAFMETLHNARTDVITKFWQSYYLRLIMYQLQQQEEEFLSDLDYIKRVCQAEIRELMSYVAKEIRTLKCEAEVNSILVVACAISEERQKHEIELQDLEEELSNKIALLEEVIKEDISRVTDFQKTTQLQSTEIVLWKRRVREIVYEFQRYINYVLKTWPGQTEYILSLEKLLDLQNIFPEEEKALSMQDLTPVIEASMEHLRSEGSSSVKFGGEEFIVEEKSFTPSEHVSQQSSRDKILEQSSREKILEQSSREKILEQSSREKMLEQSSREKILEDLKPTEEELLPIKLTPSAELQRIANIQRLLELMAPSERKMLIPMTTSQLSLLNKEVSPTHQSAINGLPQFRDDNVKDTQSAPGIIQTFGKQGIQGEDLMHQTQKVLNDWMVRKFASDEGLVLQKICEDSKIVADEKKTSDHMFVKDGKRREKLQASLEMEREELTSIVYSTEVLKELAMSRKSVARKRLGLIVSNHSLYKKDTAWATRVLTDKAQSEFKEVKERYVNPKIDQPIKHPDERVAKVLTILREHPSIRLVNV